MKASTQPFLPVDFPFQENLHTHRSVVKMYPTTSLQLNITTHKVTAKTPGGKMAQRQHSEKGGLQGTAQLGFPGKDRSG